MRADDLSIENRESTYLLCLTATITPSVTARIKRRDPVLRRADYLQAFKYWLSQTDPRLIRILFIENSGANLDEFRRYAADSDKRAEIISFPASPVPDGMHYGYAELQLIDQALSQSQLRSQTTHLIKITGRLVFPDLPKLLDRLPAAFRVAVDARARLPFRPSERGFISTQLFLASHDFYDRYLRRSYRSLAQCHDYPHYVEHLFFETLKSKGKDEGVLLRFPVNCEPVGFAGATGQNYRTLSRSLIARARAITRVVAPGFWL